MQPAAAHSLPVYDSQFTRLRADMYFPRRASRVRNSRSAYPAGLCRATRRRRKCTHILFAPAGANSTRIFDSLKAAGTLQSACCFKPSSIIQHILRRKGCSVTPSLNVLTDKIVIPVEPPHKALISCRPKSIRHLSHRLW